MSLILNEYKEQTALALQNARDIQDKVDKDSGRDMTDDEKIDFDTWVSEHKRLNAKVARREALENAESAMEQQAEGRQTTPDQPATQHRETADRVSVIRRYGKTRYFQSNDDAIEAGMFLAAKMFGRSWAHKWCNDHVREYRALSESIDSKGGFLVPDAMDQTIIDLRNKYGVFRQHAKVYPMPEEHVSIPRVKEGLTAYFVGESTAPTETDKAWDNVTLTAKKCATLTRYSSELQEDAIINIADDLTNEIARAFARKEDDCGFKGDGTSTYGGMLGAATIFSNTNALAGAVDASTNHDLYSEIDTTDLAILMTALPEYAYQSGRVKWYCSRVCNGMVFDRLKVGVAGLTIAGVEASTQKQYLGFPIVLTPSLPTVLTSLDNATMILFGDLYAAATLGERRGTRIKVSDERYMDQDQIGIMGTTRFEINVHDYGTTTAGAAGPIVALIGQI